MLEWKKYWVHAEQNNTMLDDFPKEIELRDGENAIIRIANRQDESKLLIFFLSVPEDQRDFIPLDLTDAENLQGWFGGEAWEDAFPIIAEIDDRVVSVSLLKCNRAPWCRHVSEGWMIVHENSRGLGLGRLMAREMCLMAYHMGIEKIRSEVRSDSLSAIRILKQLGYTHEGLLGGYVKDSAGAYHDLVVLNCDVRNYLQRIELQAEAAPFEIDNPAL